MGGSASNGTGPGFNSSFGQFPGFPAISLRRSGYAKAKDLIAYMYDIDHELPAGNTDTLDFALGADGLDHGGDAVEPAPASEPGFAPIADHAVPIIALPPFDRLRVTTACRLHLHPEHRHLERARDRLALHA